MEKKGDILNQLAIISDLIERINFETVSSSIIFVVEQNEFDKILNLLENKSNTKLNIIKNKFSLKIGEIDIIFSKNNV